MKTMSTLFSSSSIGIGFDLYDGSMIIDNPFEKATLERNEAFVAIVIFLSYLISWKFIRVACSSSLYTCLSLSLSLSSKSQKS